MENDFVLSSLGHTWILDLDGTIVKHNGYKIDGKDSFLDGAEDFLKSIPAEDMVIFLSSRGEDLRDMTEAFLRENGIRYDLFICGAPYGERVLLNDDKPSGLPMAHAIALKRDEGIKLRLVLDEAL